jgi:hypothetical protein
MKCDERLATAAPLLDPLGVWRGFPSDSVSQPDLDDLHGQESTGRPLGKAGFLAELTTKFGVAYDQTSAAGILPAYRTRK